MLYEVITLGGTVRCFSNETMQLAEDRMTKIAESVAAAFDATATLDFRRVFVPLAAHPLDMPQVDLPLAEGSRIPVGEGELLVMHTPGHTPGSIVLSVPGAVRNNFV